MRKSVIIGWGLFLVLLAGNGYAQALTPKEFTVKGQVKNGTSGEKVYLQLPGQSPVLLDSTTLEGDGSFVLKGIEKEGGSIYQINLGHRQLINLLAEGGETFSLTANAGSGSANGIQSEAEVTGSRNMEYYNRIMTLIVPMQQNVTQWNEAYAVAEEKKDTKQMEEIRRNFQAAEKELVGKIKGMLPEMGTSFIAVFAANNFLNPQEDLDILVELAKRVEKENPAPKYAQMFVGGIKRIKGLSEGETAPDFTLEDPDGNPVKLSSLRGKYVLIDFWASWCGPCRMENPNVVKMYNKYKDKNFEIYGVSLDKDKKAWLKAIKDDGLIWVHGSDLKYWQSDVGQAYGVSAIPATFLLDKDGKIVAKNLRGAALEAKVAELVRD